MITLLFGSNLINLKRKVERCASYWISRDTTHSSSLLIASNRNLGVILFLSCSRAAFPDNSKSSAMRYSRTAARKTVNKSALVNEMAFACLLTCRSDADLLLICHVGHFPLNPTHRELQPGSFMEHNALPFTEAHLGQHEFLAGLALSSGVIRESDWVGQSEGSEAMRVFNMYLRLSLSNLRPVIIQRELSIRMDGEVGNIGERGERAAAADTLDRENSPFLLQSTVYDLTLLWNE